MKTLLEEIMNDSTVSGEKLGLCLICNDIELYKRQKGMSNNSGSENIINQEQLDELVSRISDVEEAEKLECFVQLQSFVQRAQAMAFAYNQQAWNGCSRLLMYMAQAQQVEHARKLIENLPIIMTETQYLEMPPPGALAKQRGFALISNEFPCRPKCLTVEDYFIQPEIDCFQEMMCLENIEAMKEKICSFRTELLENGMRRNLAYNELCRLIAERIGLDEFNVFSVDAEQLIEQINEMNEKRIAFSDEIAGEGDEFSNKKRILEDVFEIIDTDAFFPCAENVEKVRCLLDDIGIFRTSLDALVDILAEKGDA